MFRMFITVQPSQVFFETVVLRNACVISIWQSNAIKSEINLFSRTMNYTKHLINSGFKQYIIPSQDLKLRKHSWKWENNLFENMHRYSENIKINISFKIKNKNKLFTCHYYTITLLNHGFTEWIVCFVVPRC